MGRVILLLSREILRLPVRDLHITTTIHLKDDLYHTTGIHGNATSLFNDKPSNMNRQMVWVKFELLRASRDRTPGVAPTSTIQVTGLAPLTDTDKSKVIAAVSAVNRGS